MLRNKRLWEGDVLRYRNPNTPKKKYPPHRVVWDPKGCKFILELPDGSGVGFPYLDSPESAGKDSSRWTIAGNIRENPSLLQKTLI